MRLSLGSGLMLATAIVGSSGSYPTLATTLATTQAQTGPATGVIVGQLVDGSSGRGVSSATVSLSPVSAEPVRVLTDENGRFVFHSLPAGSYGINATRSGYLSTYLGQTRPITISTGSRLQLSEGQRITDVVMKIWKYASISGRILDEAGEAAVAVAVRLVPVTNDGGRRYGQPYQSITDDRGAYRFGQLPPGDFIVMVPTKIVSVPAETAVSYLDAMADREVPGGNRVANTITGSGGSLTSGGTRIGDVLVQPTSARGMTPAVLINDAGRMSAYPVTFYPSATKLSAAQTITIGSGEERGGLDISMRPVPAVRVSGLVTGADGPVANFTVNLTPIGMEELAPSPSTGPETAQAITRRDGTFTAVGIPSGEYVASVQTIFGMRGQNPAGGAGTPELWGRTPVTVAGVDVDRVHVTLAPGLIVSGRIQFEPGSAPAPIGAALTRGQVVVLPAVGQLGLSTSARIAPDRSFQTSGQPPGRYSIQVSLGLPVWTLKSVTVDGQDLLGPLDLSRNVTGVVVTMTDRVSDITGPVSRPAGVTGDLYVMLVPIDPRNAQPDVRRKRLVPVSDQSTFEIGRVLEGEYAIVAAPALKAETDAVLSALAARGTHITISGRDARTIQLTAVTGR